VKDSVTTMEMTEDGKYLVIAHQEAKKVTIWDVEHDREIKTVSCPSPRFVLCRGGRCFVANYEEGTVSVIDPQNDWTVRDEILVGAKETYYLSAPGGRFFQGTILATCGPGGGRVGEITGGGVLQNRLFLVDVAKDKATEINGQLSGGIAAFSYDGREVVVHGPFMQRDGKSSIAWYHARSFLGGKSERQRHAAARATRASLLYQVRESSFWYGWDGLSAGVPPVRFSGVEEGLAFGDYTRPLVYVVKGSEVLAYRVHAMQPKVASAKIAFSEKYPEKPRFASMRFGDGQYAIHHPLAATHAEATKLFVLDGLDRRIFRCTVRLPGIKDFAELPVQQESREKGVFLPVPTEDIATSMAMTEDGKFLVVGHENAGKVSFWDVPNRKIAKSVACKSPGHIICRGGKVFVANYGEGTITVIDPAKNWLVADQVQIGEPGVYYLSAPGGEGFRGIVYATCDGEMDPRLVEVNIAKDTARLVQRQNHLPVSVVTISYDGQHLIQQGPFSHSPGGIVTAFPSVPYLSRQPANVIAGGAHQTTPYLSQVRSGEFWFGRDSVYHGMPPQPVAKRRVDEVFFPDVTRPVYHRLEASTVIVHKMDQGTTQVGSYPVSFSPRYLEKMPPLPEKHSSAFCNPVAATHGDSAFLFVLPKTSRLVFFCELTSSP
jgi:DNA-binding beta-propeller fold protein YncE